MKNYDTVIFDLDGTLLNTLEDLTDSVNYAMDKYGFHTHTIDEVRRFVGNGLKKLMERALPSDVTEEQFQAVMISARITVKTARRRRVPMREYRNCSIS